MARPINPNSRRQHDIRKKHWGNSNTVRLPIEGHDGPTPQWPIPDEPAKDELDLWEELWRTPQAIMWAESGYDRTVARYVKLYCLSLIDTRSGYLSELRQMEDRLGLSSLGLKRLGWEIVEEPTPETEQPASRWRELKAVDDIPERYKDL